MNCFKHPGVPAVGMCKFCQKGLCQECAHDLGYGLACQNHFREVEQLNAVFNKGLPTRGPSMDWTSDLPSWVPSFIMVWVLIFMLSSLVLAFYENWLRRESADPNETLAALFSLAMGCTVAYLFIYIRKWFIKK